MYLLRPEYSENFTLCLSMHVHVLTNGIVFLLLLDLRHSVSSSTYVLVCPTELKTTPILYFIICVIQLQALMHDLETIRMLHAINTC